MTSSKVLIRGGVRGGNPSTSEEKAARGGKANKAYETTPTCLMSKGEQLRRCRECEIELIEGLDWSPGDNICDACLCLQRELSFIQEREETERRLEEIAEACFAYAIVWSGVEVTS